jgi:hypothetical protein
MKKYNTVLKEIELGSIHKQEHVYNMYREKYDCTDWEHVPTGKRFKIYDLSINPTGVWFYGHDGFLQKVEKLETDEYKQIKKRIQF